MDSKHSPTFKQTQRKSSLTDKPKKPSKKRKKNRKNSSKPDPKEKDSDPSPDTFEAEEKPTGISDDHEVDSFPDLTNPQTCASRLSIDSSSHLISSQSVSALSRTSNISIDISPYELDAGENINIDNITKSLSSMSVKQKKNQKTKTQTKNLPAKNITQDGAKNIKKTESRFKVSPQPQSKASSEKVNCEVNESLRWEYCLQDTDAERERLRIYKINRRKRYLDAATSKGLGWVVNYDRSTANPIETVESGVRESLSIPEFTTIKGLVPSHSSSFTESVLL